MTHELVIFGATSFVGQILCHHLAERFAPNELNWAMAGRSVAKLDGLKASLPESHRGIPSIVADAADEAALKSMVDQARVVVSTVGPYDLYGEPLVKVCAESGVDYCDLTGEVQWIRRMIAAYEDTAVASGARIVHCCGFDSLPSDLGVYFLQQHAMERFGAYCERVKMRVRAMRGGASGGTIASMMNIAKQVAADPELRRELADPYSICPRDSKPATRQPNVSFAKHDADFDAWVTPFIMAAINTRIVHRSNALSDYTYGKDFRYDEAVLTGRGVKGRAAATTAALAIGSFMAGASMAPTRWVLEKFVPAQGEGPSPTQQEEGFFNLLFLGKTAKGERIQVKVTGDRDPGYGSTAKMLTQAGLCLARDIDKGAAPGGFPTPATIFGSKLIDRLQAHAGLTFELVDEG
ncbi:MAG: saccharopine dehydrogenase NADP-binding domain-containing protein [Pseudomonadota bacterium]